MPKTLLLADDSVTIQKVVAISFASEDIAITTVDNGDDAVTKAGELRPDVILADVVMPGKSGYEVCEAIKADPALRHIPVLLLTGTFEAFDEQRAIQAGAAGHVAKPFEAQALVERVRELLTKPAVVETVEPTPASPIAEADDAFDFFDDQPLAAQAARRPQVDDFSAAELELAPGDSAFSFGDEDLGDASDPGLSPDLEPVQPAAHTVAILPDEPSASDSISEASFSSAQAAFSPPRGTLRPSGGETVLAMPAEPETDDAFDFEFESVASVSPRETRVEAFAEVAVLDPPADSGFIDPAPSQTDFDADFGAPPGLEIQSGDATQVLASDFGDDADVASPESLAPELDDEDPFGDDEEDDEFDPDPLEEGVAIESLPRFIEESPTPAPIRAAVRDPEISEPAREPMGLDTQAAAEAVLRQVAPQLRAQLHETLERVAWEAFGQVTEKIVAQAVERVEAITWEVVPKLAETLILEEIRKLKRE